jgi:hypothetical protein
MILKAALRDEKPLCDAPSSGIFTFKVAITPQLGGKGCDCSCMMPGRRDWYGLWGHTLTQLTGKLPLNVQFFYSRLELCEHPSWRSNLPALGECTVKLGAQHL